MRTLEVKDVERTNDSTVFLLEQNLKIDERDMIIWDWKATVEEVVQDLYEEIEQYPSLLNREFVQLEMHNDTYAFGWLPEYLVAGMTG